MPVKLRGRLRCILCGANDGNRSYYKFRIREKEVDHQWLQICNLTVETYSSSMRVCGAHFKEEDFVKSPNTGYKRLVKTAVPSLLLNCSAANNMNPTHSSKPKNLLCVVCGAKDNHLSYHEFPSKSMELKMRWFQACNISPDQHRRNMRVCSKHFSEDDVWSVQKNGTRTRLKANVIPTRFLLKESKEPIKKRRNEDHNYYEFVSKELKLDETDQAPTSNDDNISLNGEDESISKMVRVPTSNDDNISLNNEDESMTKTVEAPTSNDHNIPLSCSNAINDEDESMTETVNDPRIILSHGGSSENVVFLSPIDICEVETAQQDSSEDYSVEYLKSIIKKQQRIISMFKEKYPNDFVDDVLDANIQKCFSSGRNKEPNDIDISNKCPSHVEVQELNENSSTPSVTGNSQIFWRYPSDIHTPHLDTSRRAERSIQIFKRSISDPKKKIATLHKKLGRASRVDYERHYTAFESKEILVPRNY